MRAYTIFAHFSVCYRIQLHTEGPNGIETGVGSLPISTGDPSESKMGWGSSSHLAAGVPIFTRQI